MAKRAKRSGLNSGTLAIASAFGLIYAGLLIFHARLSGENHIDGLIGVMISLYISSLPAANLLNLLFYARDELKRGMSSQAYAGWWALNLLAIAVGWLGIFLALVRYSTPQ